MKETGCKPKNGDIIAALDIGSSKICCLIAEAQDGQGNPFMPVSSRVIGIGYHRSNGIKGGVVLDADAAERSIRAAVDKAERQAGITIDEVHVSLNAGRLRSENYGAVIELGGNRATLAHVDELMLKGWQHVAVSTDAVLHALPVGFTLDETKGIQDPVGYSGQQLFADFHAVKADLQPVRQVLGCVEDCYLSPVSVVAAPYASALSTLRPNEVKEGAAVIDLGGGTSSIAVIAGGQFIYADSLSKGGIQVTAALAKRFAMSWREAELLKLQIGRGGSGRTTYPQGSDILSRQYAGILLHLKQRLADSGFALDASNYIVLTGGGAHYDEAPRLAAEIFGKPTRVAAANGSAGLPPQLVSAPFAALWGVLAHAGKRQFELAERFSASAHPAGAASLTRFGHWLRRIGKPLDTH